MKGAAAVVGVWVAGAVLLAPPSSFGECATLKPGDPRATSGTITLKPGTGGISDSVIDSAIDKWKPHLGGGCKVFGTGFPSIQRGVSGGRILTVNRSGVNGNGEGHCGSVLGLMITIYDFTTAGNNTIPCGDPATILAHELGHVMGLEDSDCAGYIMETNYENNNPRDVKSKECDKVDERNIVPGEPGHPDTDPDPPGPDPDPTAELLCVRHPEECANPASPSNPTGTSPNCVSTLACVTSGGYGPATPTSDPDGDPGTNTGGGYPPVSQGGPTLCINDPFSPLSCSWGFGYIVTPDPDIKFFTKGLEEDCAAQGGTLSRYWDCPAPFADPAGRGVGAEGASVAGWAPAVTIETPFSGLVVSGLTPVRLVVSEATYGGEILSYWIDDTEVQLIDSFEGSSTFGLCDLQQISDPSCPYVGFGGMLDTTQFSDGIHRLELYVVRNDPNFRLWNYASVEFEIRNNTQPAQPAIVVAEGWAGHERLPKGGGSYSYSFGERHISTFPFVAPFLICNLGTADLDLLNHGTMVTGEGFSRVFGSPASFVEPMRCSQLNIRFDVDDLGTYYGTVNIASTDPDDSPYTFAISGTAVGSGNGPQFVLREIENSVATGVEYVNGQTVDLGDAPATIGTKQVMEISNSGDSDLVISQLSVSGDCFWTNWIDDGLVIPPGGGYWFSTTMLCLDPDESLGAYSGTLVVRSNDGAADPFSLQLHADLVANPDPRLWVRRMSGGVPGSYVWNGSTVSFSSTGVGQPTSVLFEIRNLSSSTDLVIANPQSLVTGACFFQIGTPPNAVVAPGASTTFRVRLMCSTPGVKTGTVAIQSNDPVWPGPGTLQFAVSGEVTP